MPVILLLTTLFTFQNQDANAEERSLREQLKKANSLSERSRASQSIYDYFVKNNLLVSRMQDNDLSIKLLALWRMRHPAQTEAPQKMIDAIKVETGLLPPDFFSKSVLSIGSNKELVVKQDVDYSQTLQKRQAVTVDGSLRLNGQVVISKDTFPEVVAEVRSRLKYDDSDGKYYGYVFQKDQMQVVLYYFDDMFDFQGTILLRNAMTGQVLWKARLLGAGNLSGPTTGLVRPHKFSCSLSNKYVCIYGSGPMGGTSVYFELFELQTGQRAHAFSTLNWSP